MLFIKKIFNNNILLAEDEVSNEVVLMGRGIGFSRNSGETVDETKIEKEFRLNSKGKMNQLGQFLADLPEDYFQLTQAIVSHTKSILDIVLSDYIYLTLADHLRFAVERLDKGLNFRNPLQWELRNFYPKEYSVGMWALDEMEKQLKIRLPDDEAASIALHLINASQENSDFKTLYNDLELIQSILKIVKFHFLIEIDETSINFERFFIHLKFFAYRIRTENQLDTLGNEFFILGIKQWPEAYNCSVKIAKHVLDKKEIQLKDDEIFYLMLHIARLTQREIQNEDIKM
ncbi:BglG family transcription antiterminator LicT [Fusibacter bizertensis]